MFSNVLRFLTTTDSAVTLTAVDAFTNGTDKQAEVRMISNRATHISLVGEATSADALVPADYIELLQVDPGKSVSVLRESSESDGTVWVTEIQRV